MEKFHYNSVSVNNETVKFFPNIETLHLYEKNDQYLTGGRIIQYVDWVMRSYQEMEKMKKQNSEKESGYILISSPRPRNSVTMSEDKNFELLPVT